MHSVHKMIANLAKREGFKVSYGIKVKSCNTCIHQYLGARGSMCNLHHRLVTQERFDIDGCGLEALFHIPIPFHKRIDWTVVTWWVAYASLYALVIAGIIVLRSQLSGD